MTSPDGAETYDARETKGPDRGKRLHLGSFRVYPTRVNLERQTNKIWSTYEDIQVVLKGVIMLAGTILPIFCAYVKPLKHN